MFKKIIMYDDNEAATFKTNLSGWIDRYGYFHGDTKTSEEHARWSSCTHKICGKCGKVHDKAWVICKECRGKKEIERYNLFPKKLWDCISPICIFNSDTYFFNGVSEVMDYCKEHDTEIEKLHLCHCEPVILPLFDIDVHFEDTEDVKDYLSEEVIDAAQFLNEAIENLKPFSFTQLQIAIVFDPLRIISEMEINDI